MLKSLICFALVVGVLLAAVPPTAVARTADPLSKEEMARYAQLQAAAMDSQTLQKAGGAQGLDEQTTWLLVVGVAIVVVAALWVWAF